MKNNNIKSIILLFTYLTPLLSGVFLIHLGILHLSHLPLFNNKIILSYTINFFFTLLISSIIIFLEKKYASSLGFIFMAASFLKIALLYAVFIPSYRIDGIVAPVEFATLFLPYAICLIVEVIFLIKMLNKMP